MSYRPGLIVMAGAIVMSACVGSEASPIHHAEVSRADVVVFKEWSRYLLAGSTMWSRVEHPPVTAAVESAIWKSVRTDPGAADPMVNFLLWKQSLNPVRFAHYHPKLAPVLHRISLARSSSTLIQHVMAPTTTSIGGSAAPAPASPVISEPQNLIPPASPEPSTLLMAAGMAVWAIFRARSRRRDG